MAKRLARLLFLLTVLLSLRTTYADTPPYGCDEYCNGAVRVYECDFWGGDTSTCSCWAMPPGGGPPVNLCGSPWDFTLAHDDFAGLCHEWASAHGQGGLEWFVMDYCFGGPSNGGGSVEGAFYCSFDDSSCVE
jgi:hypothetical protein